MRRADLTRLIALTVIWSASFVFIRVLVPVFGPVWVATLRVLIAGVALVAWFAVIGVKGDVRQHWRAYLLIGVVNSGLPFLLFAYAALHLPASYLVILNAATPLFAALASAVWLSEPLTRMKLTGLFAGAAGVAFVSRAGPVEPDASFALAVAASLAAALCYALAGVWLKKKGHALRPVAIAGWSQLFAAFVLLPIAVPTTIPGPVTTLAIVNVSLLALLCSGAAYLLYCLHIADVGPTRATTVSSVAPPTSDLMFVRIVTRALTRSQSFRSMDCI